MLQIISVGSNVIPDIVDWLPTGQWFAECPSSLKAGVYFSPTDLTKMAESCTIPSLIIDASTIAVMPIIYMSGYIACRHSPYEA